MRIQVLGPDCVNCRTLEERVRRAVCYAGVTAEVEHISDPLQIGRMAVILTPALAIDGKVKVSGRLPSEAELVSIITTAAAETE
ncbi:MAG: thioredoxin family protein [Armatimonadota bacterium]